MRRFNRTLALLTIAAALAFLTACGGNASPAPATPAPTPTASGGTTTPPSSGGTTTPPTTTPPTTTPPTTTPPTTTPPSSGGSGSGGSGSGGSGSGGGAATGADFVYISDEGTAVNGVSINVATKTMKPVPGSPFATPNAWDVAHAGSLVFVTSTNLTDTTNNALYVYRSDATTGTLTLLKTITQPTGPTNVPVNVFADPSGQNLYISSASDAILIYGFAIDQASGNLTPLPGSPYASFDTGNRGWMYNAQFTPDGKLLFGIECPYAGGRFCSTYIVSMQRDPSTGVLTRPANNAARNDFNAMAIAGNYVIGTWWSSYIHVYSYDASGVLTEVSGSPTTPENSTTQESCAVAWQSGTNRVYIGSANGSGGPTNPGAITAYALDSSGKLSPISGASRSTGGVNTTCSLEFTPSGFLTFTTASGLEGYSVNSDATLTPLAGSPQPAGSKPRAQTSLHSSTGQ